MTARPAFLGSRWIGRWIAVVGVIHGAGAAVLYHSQFAAMLAAGLVNSADDYSPRAAAYWFAVASPALVLIGLLVDQVEKTGARVPWSVALVFTGMLAAMLVVMPANGAWLLIPPALGLLFRRG
jgi:hypothetical protein